MELTIKHFWIMKQFEERPVMHEDGFIGIHQARKPFKGKAFRHENPPNSVVKHRPEKSHSQRVLKSSSFVK
jgi:hypothetical protein